ncbi:MAG: hypothetical protein K6T65_14795 [Peptococcaceae bacterium]|nr:hypothetical protein [Peptococcaceae bacterium]
METIRTSNNVDLQAIYRHFEKLCSECDRLNTPQCKEPTCLVGFGKKALRFAMQKGLLDIPGAKKIIPNGDMKAYYPETVAPGLAETCRQCRQCRDNHSPDCVIALARTCLEHTNLSSEIDYPGSVFMYLAKLKEQNPRLSDFVAAELKKSSPK